MKTENDALDAATKAVPPVRGPLQSTALRVPQTQEDRPFRFLGCQDPYCSGERGGRIRKMSPLYNQIRHQMQVSGRGGTSSYSEEDNAISFAAATKLFGLT
jgi:hypothetical protein